MSVELEVGRGGGHEVAERLRGVMEVLQLRQDDGGWCIE